MTNSIPEIPKIDLAFVTGSNTTENHPVIGAQILQAVKNGAKLIVADPRRIELAQHADVFLQLKPGTNVALLNAMMHVIYNEGLYDEEFVAERTSGLSDLVDVIQAYTPEKASEICGVDPDLIRKAARLYAHADRASIFYAMGITQHSSGTGHVMTVSNLAMMCGNIGKPHSGVNPLRGQNNVQGACDMGGLPDDLPGYQKVTNPEVIQKFEALWDAKLSYKRGMPLTKMMDAAHHGEIKLMYIMGENPMVSDPDTEHIRESLESLDCLIVQDIFPTETTELADVVLPVACFAEKDGTFTNTERRIQRVRKAVNAPGEAKADWQIFVELMKRLGMDAPYEKPDDVMREIAKATHLYGGITYDRIEHRGLQWPCPTTDHPGTPYLHRDKFSRGTGLFIPVHHVDAAELQDAEYPLILTTGRILYHYHTRTMTKRVEGLHAIAPEGFIEISPETADRLGIVNEELVKVSSRRGSVDVKARVTDIIQNEVVFMPFHFAEASANILTNASALDEISSMPELKVCAVRVEKIETV
jgi:formate dehydrogenase major subunit